jgi:glycosyltransferase involved in cell wall biosynthesis
MHEGWGMVTMEAASVGTPTLAFDVAGIRDAIVDGETGHLAGTVEDFERRWIALALDAGGRARLGAGAQAWAGRHSWPATIDRFEAVLHAAVRAAGARAAAPAR